MWSMGVADSEVETSLPFNLPKQRALLGHILTDDRFFLMAQAKIEAGWWGSTRLAQLWELALKVSGRFRRAPLPQEVSQSELWMSLAVAEQNALNTELNLCLDQKLHIGLDMLQAELTDWLRTRIYVTAMKRSETLFNAAARGMKDAAKMEQAYEVVRNMTKEIEDATFVPGKDVAMDDIEADFKQEDLGIDKALDFGVPTMNKLLLPQGGGKGCLLRGDMTVFLAPTNVGKTTAMISVAVANVLAGKDVLLVTHEGRVDDIKLKVWQCAMGMTRAEIVKNLSEVNGDYHEHFMAYLQMQKDKVAKHLAFMPLNQAGLTVEEVDVAIRRRQERWQSTHLGKGFDLLVDDYPAKLTTKQAQGGHFALRQIQEIVYNYFTQMALEHGFHVLTAIQTNREGSRVNRRQDKEKSRLLTMEDVSEAWGPMTTATNVITINRDPVAQAQKIVTFYVVKSRSSEVGWAVVCKSDYASARSHWFDADSTFYRGEVPLSGQLDTLLDNYKGQEIPAEAVIKNS
jgi:phage anti-repressor protein